MVLVAVLRVAAVEGPWPTLFDDGFGFSGWRGYGEAMGDVRYTGNGSGSGSGECCTYATAEKMARRVEICILRND